MHKIVSNNFSNCLKSLDITDINFTWINWECIFINLIIILWYEKIQNKTMKWKLIKKKKIVRNKLCFNFYSLNSCVQIDFMTKCACTQSFHNVWSKKNHGFWKLCKFEKQDILLPIKGQTSLIKIKKKRERKKKDLK